MDISVIVVVVIVTALVFDFTNGFHDTANAVATSIATGALRPRTAVLLAGILNMVGAFLSVAVAKTISSGLVDDTKITPTAIFAGLAGAIVWNLLTWLVGMPSSSSHALIGGLIGATWVAAGADAVKFASVLGKVLLPAVLSPIIAGVVALIATRLAYRITARGEQRTVTKGFKLGQIVSGSMVALAHGTNDAQKTMGVITLTLITVGALPADAGPPFWVILSSGSAIALGTYAGGWRIIQTLGMRVSRIQAPQGFAAGTSTATVILTSSHLGFPLSTTQVATGAIFGAGTARGVASVRWGIGGQVTLAWLLTLPAAAAFGVVAAWTADSGPLGTVVVAVVLLGIAGGIYAASRRRPVTADNVTDVPAPPLHAEPAVRTEESNDHQLGSARRHRSGLVRHRRARHGPGVDSTGRALGSRVRAGGRTDR
jgi:PiT family inorganic phosphate transporter